MPNKDIFTGSDASLVLAVDDKSVAEGKLADDLLTEYELSSLVGELKDVKVNVQTDVRAYHAIGQRHASQLRTGNITVSGSAERAHINGALIKLLLGEGAGSPPPAGGIVQPTFNMVLNLKNPALPENGSKLVLFGVKFDSWNFALPEDDFVMEEVTFRALRIAQEDAGN
ncbi:MAG: hypothetical protein AAGA66_02370 [Bacteroidota bacterium]